MIAEGTRRVQVQGSQPSSTCGARRPGVCAVNPCVSRVSCCRLAEAAAAAWLAPWRAGGPESSKSCIVAGLRKLR